MRPALFVIATALFAASPALAQQLPPPPPIADPKPFHLPASETWRLANGMAVTLVPYGIAPKAVVALRVAGGHGVEEGQTWLATLVAEMMKQGAGGRTAAQLATAAAAMGGDLDIGASLQATTIAMNILSEHAAEAIGLIGDVALRPALPESELARVKANLARERSVALSQPGVIADIALGRAVYGADHPYGRLVPDAAQLAGYTIGDARHFHAGQFGARRAHLYIVGQFDGVAVKAAIAKAFGGWAAGPDVARIASPHAPGPRVILVDRPGAPQATVRLAFDAAVAGSDADMPQRVANALLGGAFSSRITRNIREDKGYTYSPRSGIDFNPQDALWSFDADITTDKTGAALAEIFKEIRRMQADRVGDEEAKGIRTYLAGLFAIRNSTARAIQGTLAERDMLGLPVDWTDRYVPAVLAVTPEQMMAAARSGYPLDRMTLIVVGDLKTVAPQLKALPELASLAFQRVAVP